jgi:hypothetical protein
MSLCSFCNRKICKYCKNEHTLKCQNMNMIQNNDKMISTPSIHSIYKMVLELQKENDKLKNKIKRLEQKTFKKKEKKTILEWLEIHGNTIYDETILEYSTIHEKYQPTEFDLTHLFQSGYIEGYGRIIQKYCTDELCYFVAWEQKKQIYCWKNKWTIFTIDDITTIISKIQKKIMALFSDWSKKQRNNIQMNKYMGMILGGEMNERKKKNKTIYLNLWDAIKKDFHKETEYQIIFK